MSNKIRAAFKLAKEQGRPAFVAYGTAGMPNPVVSPAVFKAMQDGGADLIEVGVPFTDPLAEGGTIQGTNQRALDAGTVTMDDVLELVKQTRKLGVTVPMVMMGYYNPFLQYGDDKLIARCQEVGISGFIIVDLPPEESLTFRQKCRAGNLSCIPLVAPTTTEKRLESLCKCADSFVYAVSLTGVTGERAEVNTELPDFINRVKGHLPSQDISVAVGFGISTREHFEKIGKLADGCIIGSALMRTVDAAGDDAAQIAEAVVKYSQGVCNRKEADIQAGLKAYAELGLDANGAAASGAAANGVPEMVSSTDFRFGEWGGRYVPEVLVQALEELESTYSALKQDPSFWEEFESYYDYIGRPSSLHIADRLTEECGGAEIWLKREDLNHTGSHKINNAVGQALVAKRLGKKRIIAETGAGQHGVATATVCAKMGMELVVYMGAEDVRRQGLNVFRMEMLGAKVVAVESGSRTLKDAINEAMRDWVTNIRTTHYLVGSVIGPHPFPTIVRDFQSVIGKEARQQMLEKAGALPDYVVACVGGGSNAMGIFHPFYKEESVKLVGVEAGGDGPQHHSATLTYGTPGVLHGTRTYLLQEHGQITGTHSISAGLDYPGVGPEHAFYKDSHRAEYVSVTDHEALLGFKAVTMKEGIIPALETAHAVYYAMELAKKLPKDKKVLICFSGRGDKDVHTIREELPKHGCKLRIREQIEDHEH
eukprot:Clim_evm23s139 gene=Clim_evmTU23s139